MTRSILLIAACFFFLTPNTSFAQDKITFDDHIMPIFRQRCATCHNPNKKSGGLDVTNYSSLMQGGSAGSSIEPGDSDGSYLFNLVTHEDSPEMPPNSDKIPQSEIDTLAKWIDGGALENKKSKSTVSKKPSYALSADANPTARPAQIPLPPRMSLEPFTVTPRPTAIRAMAVSPWAPLIAIASQKQIILYDTKTLRFQGALAFPEGRANVLKFSRNGKLLLAGGGRDSSLGKVIVWDITTGERIIEVGNEIDTVLAADISPDQSMVALGGPQKLVRVYSTESGEQLYEIKKHTDWATTLEFSPDGVLLATGDRNGGLFVWEAETGREYLTLKGHTKMISSVSWRSDSNVLASASEDTTVRLWEMENGAQIKLWGAHGGGVSSVIYTRDGRIVTSGRDRTTKLWDGNGGGQRTFEAFTDVATTATVCNESLRVVATDWTGEIRIWNLNDGKRLGNFASNPPTIAAQLAQADQHHKAAATKHQPLKDAAAKANQALTVKKQQLAAFEKTLADAQATIKKIQAEQAELTKQKTTNDQQKTSLTGSLAQHRQATTLLNESLQKANAAAQKLPGNAQLQTSARSLAQQVEQLKQTSLMVETELKQVDAKIASNNKRLTELNQQLVANQAIVKSSQQSVQTTRTQIQPLQTDATNKTNAANQAAAELNSAVATLKFWQGEQAFHNQLLALKKQLEQANTESAQRQSELESAKTKLAESQKLMQASQATALSAQQKVDAIRQQIQETTKRQ